MTSIELLSPAKDLECGKAAILAGADAVYMGGPRFGARQNAGNPLSDFQKLADFAHFYSARIYATLNTVLLESELDEAQRLIHQFYEAGADALILQDMGILEMDLPPIPLFASTQTHNLNLKKIKFLEQTGFQRVILGRELSLAQIQEIRQQTSVELETFVHGALCVSQSGQCYLSYALGGRSGNRGECAQPCRERYTLKDSREKILEENRHLLSLKDLNLKNHLEALLDAGVTSFKIEGRLKDIPYAINVTAAYRQALDTLLEKKNFSRASAGKSVYDFEPDLNKSFNRESSSYFLNGRVPGLGSWDTPKWKGEPLGPVKQTGPRWFELLKPATVAPADGIAFFDSQGELKGTLINAVEETRVFPNSMEGIKKDTLIFRNYSHEFQKRLTAKLPSRKIEIHLAFSETKTGFCLRGKDESGIQAEIKENLEKIPAQHEEKAKQTLEKQLTKTGDSYFQVTKLTLNLSKIWFFPVSTLNELRRKLILALENQRQKHPVPLQLKKINLIPYFETRLDYSANITNSLARKFYEKRGVTILEPGAEAGACLTGKKLMTLKFCLLYERGQCLKNESAPKKIFTLKHSKGTELELRLNCEACENEIYLKKKETLED